MQVSSLRVALVGAGSMGSNHARTIAMSADTVLSAVVDRDLNRAAEVADRFGAVASSSLEAALRSDAVVVATTAESHLEVASQFLEAGIPTLVEKPLALDPREVASMLSLAEVSGTPFMCGFVERFNPVVVAAREHLLMEGPPIHLVGLRHSPPNPRAVLSVVHDLLIHDLDLVFALTGELIAEPGAGTAWISPHTGFAEIADATLKLASGAVATVSASRAGQRKVREFRVATESALLELDLLRRTLTIYRHVSQEALRFASGYRAETVVDLPFVRQEGEPLALQLRHFVGLARGEVDPITEFQSTRPAHDLAFQVEHRSLPLQAG